MTSNEENLALMESLFDKEMAPIVQSLEMVSAHNDVLKHRKLAKVKYLSKENIALKTKINHLAN